MIEQEVMEDAKYSHDEDEIKLKKLEELLEKNTPQLIIGRYIRGKVKLTQSELTKVIKLKNQKECRKKHLQNKKNSV